MNELKEFPANDFLTVLLPVLTTLSEAEVSPELAQKIKDFIAAEHTDPEIYQFCDKIAQAAFHGEASTFIMELCNVQKWYLPPLGTLLTIECEACKPSEK